MNITSRTAAADGLFILPDHHMALLESACDWAIIVDDAFVIKYCHKCQSSVDDILPHNLIEQHFESFLPSTARAEVMQLLRANAGRGKSGVGTIYHDHLAGYYQIKSMPLVTDGFSGHSITICHATTDNIATARKDTYKNPYHAMDEHIAHQLEQQKMIAELSVAFAKNARADMGELIAHALQTLGSFMKVDRCSIFRHDLENRTYSVLYEWHAPNVPSTKHMLQAIPYNESDEGFIQLTTRPYIAVDDTFQFSGEAYKVQRESGVYAFADIPILCNGAFWGFLGVDYGNGPHYWTDSEFHMLQTIGSVLSSVLEKHGMELQLHDTYSKLSEIVANYPGIIWAVDRDNMLTLFEGNGVEGLGADGHAVLGRRLEDLIAAHGGMDARILQHHSATFEKGNQSFFANIGDRHFTCETILLHTLDREVSGVMGVALDVTDMQQMQVKLEEAIHMAEQASQAKSDFLATMSHEIRTPMNAVKGLSELLSLTDLDAVQRNYMENIMGASNTLLGIINDILDFTKISANRIEIISEAYQMQDLIASLCNVVNVKAEDKGLLLMVDIAPDMPSVLYGDEFRIKQVLTNLLTNAVKYTHKGFVRLCVDMERSGDGGTMVCSVADSGIGIRAEDIPSLFDAFSRVDLQANRNIMGTGLGLSIAKQLVVTMGGEIDVNSVYGEGTIFTIRLPQRIMNGDPIARVDAPWTKRVLLLGAGARSAGILSMLESLGVEGVARAEQDIPDRLDGYTHCIFSDAVQGDMIRSLRERMPMCRFSILKDIRHAMSMPGTHETVLYTPLFIFSLASFLNQTGREKEATAAAKPPVEEMAVRDTLLLVVDDNEINRLVSSEMLNVFQAQVICAEDGYKAVELCERQRFDLIFMDHMMPGKDGIETTREIRRGNGPNRDTPILALTANIVNDMKSHYLENGMNDCLSKPIDLSDLEGALIRWLPAEKIVNAACAQRPDCACAEPAGTFMSQSELIIAMDQFGLYASDVMNELNGDFDTYIRRMEAASEGLGALVSALKEEVASQSWAAFADDILRLQGVLYGIGARDCATRARQLSAAARGMNIDYVYEDFFSLMGNMYMLEQKLTVLVPVGRGESLRALPLGDPQYLLDCLEKLGLALARHDAEGAMRQIAHTAGFSLDMDLDMALKAIRVDLESSNLEAAYHTYTAFFQTYTSRFGVAATQDADGVRGASANVGGVLREGQAREQRG